MSPGVQVTGGGGMATCDPGVLRSGSCGKREDVLDDHRAFLPSAMGLPCCSTLHTLIAALSTVRPSESERAGPRTLAGPP
jgi:hypothetical protein